MRPIQFNSYWRSTSIVKNSCCQEDAALLNVSVENAEKLRKTAKSGYPTSFRTSLFSASSWNKISHMKLQSLKMFKTTKDIFLQTIFFFFFFFFFANWQGRLWGFVNLVLYNIKIKIVAFIINFRKTKPSEIVKCTFRNGASVLDEFALFNWSADG